MSEMKECFGRCAHLSIRYRDLSRQHFLHVDEEKLQECNECPLFAQCMFLRHNEVIRDLLRMMDQPGSNVGARIG